jgi:hypothetical protein
VAEDVVTVAVDVNVVLGVAILDGAYKVILDSITGHDLQLNTQGLTCIATVEYPICPEMTRLPAMVFLLSYTPTVPV